MRLRTNWPAQLLELIVSPCQVTVTAPPQSSLAVTLLGFGAGTWPAQLTVRLAGHLRLGGLVSWMVMVWMQVALLPHRSVPRYVRLRTKPAQLLELIVSPCQVTVTGPPQVSLAVTLLVFGAGTWLAQFAVRLAGHVRLGGLVALAVIVWGQVALLPQASVAR